MGITANTFDMRTLPSAGKDWHESLQTEDARGCEEIKAAESGFSHYITKLTICADTNKDVAIGSGETADAVTTVHFGPIPFKIAVGATISKFNWEAPPKMGIKCTSGLSVTIDSSALGTLSIEAHGKTCKD